MEIAKDKIDHFVQALNHFINLIDAEASSRRNHPALFLQRLIPSGWYPKVLCFSHSNTFRR
jgi:hypothetical protein